MDSATTDLAKPPLKSFKAPSTLPLRFVAKRSFRSSLIIGLIFGFYMIVKATSFIKAYPTDAARQKLAESLGSNVGIEALIGVAHRIETVGGYLTWNFLCLIAAAGAIWALLIATRTFRGEEDSGRWELLLAGQTTARRAAFDGLIGLLTDLGLIFIVLLGATLLIGKMHGANISFDSSIFFAATSICGIAEFLAVGLLTSQLMPVRSRAAGLAVAVFGVFYSLRLVADTTSAHWLLDLSPLGWIERLQPLYASDTIWFLPIIGFVVLVSGYAISLAGKRDLGAAKFSEKPRAKLHDTLLKSPFAIGFRLNRTVMLGRTAIICAAGFFYGLLSKAAVKALTGSAGAQKALGRLDHSSQNQAVAGFVGIVFFIIMVIALFYVANSVNRIREDEAEGYLDNFLVRTVSRISWLWGRLNLIFISLISVAVGSGLSTWLGLASQHSALPLHQLFAASFNAIVPTLFVIGFGIFGFGLVPRLTSWFTYGLVGLSFLITMLGSGLNLNHWILDLSLLHQVSLAPATNPNWTTNAIIALLGLSLCIIGTLCFNKRDLQPS